MSVSGIIVGAVLTFIFTGVLANWLVQRWQYRNWMNQQRFLGSEKKYEALKTHADEIAKLSAARLSAMFRLIQSLEQSDERVQERLKIYSDALDDWQKSINSFYFKTTMYVSFHMTKRLEDEINDRFARVGRRIEKSVRGRLANEAGYGSQKIEIMNELYSMQGALVAYNRDMLRHVLERHAATYHGVRLRYNRTDLHYLTTWQLFKALLITRVDEFSVTLTSFELERPARSDD